MCNRTTTSRVTRRQILGFMTAGSASMVLPARAQAQFPSRTIELVVAYGAGGTSDVYYRGLANILARQQGWQVIILNKSGAGSTIGTAFIKNAKPDGYTIGNITEVMMRERLLGTSDAFDPLRDFTYIGVGAMVPFGWAVRVDSPIKSLAQLVETGRSAPKSLSYGSAGSPKLPSWAMKLLEFRTGAQFLGVPFASSAAILTSALGGHIDLICDALGALAGSVASGHMRMLAVSTEERLPQWPDVPTAKELGFDVVTTLPYGVGGPANMPPDVVAKFEDALLKAFKDPAHQELLNNLNMAPWIRMGKDFDAYMRAQYKDMPAQLRAFGALNT